MKERSYLLFYLLSHKAVLRCWKDKTVYVVGESTGQAVRSLLDLDSRGQHTGSAETLASYISQVEKEGKFLFPRGNLARPTLVSVLTSSAHYVDEVTVYETVTNRDLLSSLQSLEMFPDYFVIFSPSGAAASLPILEEHHHQKLKQSKIIAIGPTTRAEIERLGFQVHKVVSQPSAESLGDLLTEDIQL